MIVPSRATLRSRTSASQARPLKPEVSTVVAPVRATETETVFASRFRATRVSSPVGAGAESTW